MIYKTRLQAIQSILLVLSLALAMPAVAQMGGMMGKQDKGAGMTQMSGMMRDMGKNMQSMSEQMDHGNMSSTQQKTMAERMRNMGSMMDKMSDMMGDGMMMDDAQQNQMHDMRKQMERMMKGSGGMN